MTEFRESCKNFDSLHKKEKIKRGKNYRREEEEEVVEKEKGDYRSFCPLFKLHHIDCPLAANSICLIHGGYIKWDSCIIASGSESSAVCPTIRSIFNTSRCSSATKMVSARRKWEKRSFFQRKKDNGMRNRHVQTNLDKSEGGKFRFEGDCLAKITTYFIADKREKVKESDFRSSDSEFLLGRSESENFVGDGMKKGNVTVSMREEKEEEEKKKKMDEMRKRIDGIYFNGGKEMWPRKNEFVDILRPEEKKRNGGMGEHVDDDNYAFSPGQFESSAGLFPSRKKTRKKKTISVQNQTDDFIVPEPGNREEPSKLVSSADLKEEITEDTAEYEKSQGSESSGSIFFTPFIMIPDDVETESGSSFRRCDKDTQTTREMDEYKDAPRRKSVTTAKVTTGQNTDRNMEDKKLSVQSGLIRFLCGATEDNHKEALTQTVPLTSSTHTRSLSIDDKCDCTSSICTFFKRTSVTLDSEPRYPKEDVKESDEVKRKYLEERNSPQLEIPDTTRHVGVNTSRSTISQLSIEATIVVEKSTVVETLKSDSSHGASAAKKNFLVESTQTDNFAQPTSFKMIQTSLSSTTTVSHDRNCRCDSESDEKSQFLNPTSPSCETYVAKSFVSRESDTTTEKKVKKWLNKSHSESEVYCKQQNNKLEERVIALPSTSKNYTTKPSKPSSVLDADSEYQTSQETNDDAMPVINVHGGKKPRCGTRKPAATTDPTENNQIVNFNDLIEIIDQRFNRMADEMKEFCRYGRQPHVSKTLVECGVMTDETNESEIGKTMKKEIHFYDDDARNPSQKIETHRSRINIWQAVSLDEPVSGAISWTCKKCGNKGITYTTSQCRNADANETEPQKTKQPVEKNDNSSTIYEMTAKSTISKKISQPEPTPHSSSGTGAKRPLTPQPIPHKSTFDLAIESARSCIPIALQFRPKAPPSPPPPPLPSPSPPKCPSPNKSDLPLSCQFVDFKEESTAFRKLQTSIDRTRPTATGPSHDMCTSNVSEPKTRVESRAVLKPQTDARHTQTPQTPPVNKPNASLNTRGTQRSMPTSKQSTGSSSPTSPRAKPKQTTPTNLWLNGK